MTAPNPTIRLAVYNSDDSGLPVLAWHKLDGTIDAVELEPDAALKHMHDMLLAIEKYKSHWQMVDDINTIGDPDPE